LKPSVGLSGKDQISRPDAEQSKETPASAPTQSSQFEGKYDGVFQP
jgi:hypothetical protein